jgi:hypothetical protein
LDIVPFISEWYCQYQQNDCDTDNDRSVWGKRWHYRIKTITYWYIYYYYYHSLSYWIHCDTSDNVCVDLQIWGYRKKHCISRRNLPLKGFSGMGEYYILQYNNNNKTKTFIHRYNNNKTKTFIHRYNNNNKTKTFIHRYNNEIVPKSE